MATEWDPGAMILRRVLRAWDGKPWRIPAFLARDGEERYEAFEQAVRQEMKGQGMEAVWHTLSSDILVLTIHYEQETGTGPDTDRGDGL